MNILMRRLSVAFCLAGMLGQGSLQAGMSEVLKRMTECRDTGKFSELRSLLEKHYFKSPKIQPEVADFVLKSALAGHEIFMYWHVRGARFESRMLTEDLQHLLAIMIINMVLVKSSMDASALIGHHDPAWKREANPFVDFLYNYEHRLTKAPVFLLEQDEHTFGYQKILECARELWLECDFENLEQLQLLPPPVCVRCFVYGTSYVTGYGTDIYCGDALEDIWQTQKTVKAILKSIYVERLNSFEKTWETFDSFRNWQEFFSYKPDLRPIGEQAQVFGVVESVSPSEQKNASPMPMTPPSVSSSPAGTKGEDSGTELANLAITEGLVSAPASSASVTHEVHKEVQPADSKQDEELTKITGATTSSSSSSSGSSSATFSAPSPSAGLAPSSHAVPQRLHTLPANPYAISSLKKRGVKKDGGK